LAIERGWQEFAWHGKRGQGTGFRGQGNCGFRIVDFGLQCATNDVSWESKTWILSPGMAVPRLAPSLSDDRLPWEPCTTIDTCPRTYRCRVKTSTIAVELAHKPDALTREAFLSSLASASG
jgi:hypothetical protein